MKLDVFRLPEGMDRDSIVTVRVGDVMAVYTAGFMAGLADCDPREDSAVIEVAPAPWLGDEGR